MKELQEIIYSFNERVKAMQGLESLIDTKELINQLVDTSEEMVKRYDYIKPEEEIGELPDNIEFVGEDENGNGLYRVS